MVDVTVGQQDLFDCDLRLLGRGLQSRQIAAGIDERPGHRLGAPQKGAVLLQRRHRDDCRTKGRLAHFASKFFCQNIRVVQNW